eukprot:2939541-Rhodomonas_salina.1
MEGENVFQALLRQGDGHIRRLATLFSGPEPDPEPFRRPKVVQKKNPPKDDAPRRKKKKVFQCIICLESSEEGQDEGQH